ncbi:ROK family transcriptional regulator [Spirillospora sp. NPDC048911]|uniref:ROK family transcriptional regulator n=1 Tax=Spirillospora sp. NPDC048911 TaxID=3364527 RepID=UPI003715099C
MKTATPAMARAINDRLALDLLLAEGPLTAPQLRTLTGLSRPTVSDLLERLQADGLIQVTGEYGEDRRGPNARLYGLVAGRAHVAGVDVRRGSLHVTVADIIGGVAGSATKVAEPDDLASFIAATVAEAAAGRELHTVVLGAPGLVDPRTGLTTDSGLPGWRPDLAAAVREALADRLTVQDLVLENEVNLATVAEHRVGSAAGHEDFALLWLDDGVGAGVVLGGRLRRGVSGGAGEVGFLDSGGVEFCNLMEARFTEGLALEAAADRIVKGVLTLVAVLDPGLVVLGGRTGREGGDELAALVADRLSARSPAPTAVRPTTVEGNAILQGAVLTALDRTRDAIYG